MSDRRITIRIMVNDEVEAATVSVALAPILEFVSHEEHERWLDFLSDELADKVAEAMNRVPSC